MFQLSTMHGLLLSMCIHVVRKIKIILYCDGLVHFFHLFCFLTSGISSLNIDFRSTQTPEGDVSDFFNINDTVQLDCAVDPETMSYTVHIRINDTELDSGRLSSLQVADRMPILVSTNVTAQLDIFVFQCFASHNDPDGMDQNAVFTIFVNPFFTFTTTEVVLVTNGTVLPSPCIADGNPEPTVQLFLESSLVVPDLRASDTLQIQFGDDGMYQCIASTPGADRDAEFMFTIISK